MLILVQHLVRSFLQHCYPGEEHSRERQSVCQLSSLVLLIKPLISSWGHHPNDLIQPWLLPRAPPKMTINTEFRNRVSFQHIGFGEHTRARAAPFPLIAAEEQICSAVELTVTRFCRRQRTNHSHGTGKQALKKKKKSPLGFDFLPLSWQDSPALPENAGVTGVFLHAQSLEGRLSRDPYLYKHCLNLSSKFIRTVLAIEAWCAKPLKWPPGLSLRFPSLPSATHNSKTEQLCSIRGCWAIPVYPRD